MKRIRLFQWVSCAAIIVGTILLAVAPKFALGQTSPTVAPIKIGIIGSGNIGSTLGTVWAQAGDQGFFSSRNPDNLKTLGEKVGPRARAGTGRDAIPVCDVGLVSVPYRSMPGIAQK